jgi:hypothetical protein
MFLQNYLNLLVFRNDKFLVDMFNNAAEPTAFQCGENSISRVNLYVLCYELSIVGLSNAETALKGL